MRSQDDSPAFRYLVNAHESESIYIAQLQIRNEQPPLLDVQSLTGPYPQINCPLLFGTPFAIDEESSDLEVNKSCV